ncbi:hypothetical protein IWW48_004211 [Coemansia sp. RSA 1200]|nr:hypothetical protein IWW48_004211 [Coemansia sp. RSA 1200]
MQANTRTERAEVRREMWSPYPDHNLTLWAMPPENGAAGMYTGSGGSSSPSKMKKKKQQQQQARVASRAAEATSKQRRLQWWQVSRDFKIGDRDEQGGRVAGCSKGDGATGASGTRGKTTEVLASHRLNFGNQSIRRLSIPVSSVPLLGGLVELRMPQNKLARLPASLFMLTQLEILNLENNYLDESHMPDHLWRQLVSLRVLFLAGNRFRQLPPSLGRMPRLFYLDVCDNHALRHLPVELLASPSLGTLAANRCSADLAERIDMLCESEAESSSTASSSSRCVPLLEMAPGSPASSTAHPRVPSLAAICVRQIHLAISNSNEKEDEMVSPMIAAACARIRRNPDDYVVSRVLLEALDAVEALALCSVCNAPVFYPAFTVARQVESVELPVSWHCCSAACRDKAASQLVVKTANSYYIK